MLVALHRLIGWLASRHAQIDRVVGGARIDLLHAGQLDPMAMRRAMVSAEDLKASLRATLQCESHRDIDRIVVERNGKVTFVVRRQTAGTGDAGTDQDAHGMEKEQRGDRGEKHWKTHEK